MKTVIPPHEIQFSLRETSLMREGRRHRARHKPKTLSYWIQTALGIVWLYALIKGLLAIPTLPNVADDEQVFWNVIGCCATLTMVTAAMITLHFKLKDS